MSSEPPVLTTLYNWCPLSSCKSIVKAGRAFTRKGLKGQYKLGRHPSVLVNSVAKTFFFFF